MNTVNSPRAIPWRLTQAASSPVISLISRELVSIVRRSCAIRIGIFGASKPAGRPDPSLNIGGRLMLPSNREG